MLPHSKLSICKTNDINISVLKALMRLTKEVSDFEDGLVLKYTSRMVVIIPNVIFFSPSMWGTRQKNG